jgi:hypothetical protein
VRALRWIAIGAAMLLASPWLATAQRVQLQAPQGTLYVGTPVELRLTAEDFEEEPQPEASVAVPEKGRLELVGVSPQVSTSVTIINGQVTQSKEVRFVYRYRYLPTEPGTVELGPFVVTQGSLSRATQAIRLNVGEVPLSDRLRVRLKLPEEARFVGEHVPVTLEFWLDSDLQANLHSYSLRAPVFELGESFQVLDEPASESEVEVNIETASGGIRLSGSVSQAVANGQRFVVVSVTRTLVPLRAGRYELEPATLIVNELTQWQRGLFTGRRGTRKLRATDRSRVLDVKPVPREGMPPSFAGAVGRGYTLEVSADRTIVQVGDPITLQLTLRGEGNLESAGLPGLNAEGLLPPSEFRVPEGDLTGRYEEGEKRFTAVVRVLDERVREIPAMSYSWFDAQQGAYQTTRSRPIALSVRPAEVVAAEDVFSAEAKEQEEPEEVEERGAESFTLTGADLAIERDASILLRDRRRGPKGPWMPVALYAGTSLLVLAALFDRRRRDVDPALLRRRKLLEGERARLRGAAKLPGDRAVVEIAQSLRRMLAEVPEARSVGLDAFLAECDARSYAPADQRRTAQLDPEFHARALALADEIVEPGA